MGNLWPFLGTFRYFIVNDYLPEAGKYCRPTNDFIDLDTEAIHKQNDAISRKLLTATLNGAITELTTGDPNMDR
jgi:hypothetical protein